MVTMTLCLHDLLLRLCFHMCACTLRSGVVLLCARELSVRFVDHFEFSSAPSAAKQALNRSPCAFSEAKEQTYTNSWSHMS